MMAAPVRLRSVDNCRERGSMDYRVRDCGNGADTTVASKTFGAFCGLAPSLWSATNARTPALKLVATTNDGPNEVMARESLAQGLYLGVQIIVLDDPARPDAANQLVFADDGPVGLDQRHKDIESTPAERQRPTVDEKFAVPRRDPEPAELEARRSFGSGIHGRRL